MTSRPAAPEAEGDRDPTRTKAARRDVSAAAPGSLAQLGTHRHRRLAERLAPFDLHPRHYGMLNQLAVNEGQSQQASAKRWVSTAAPSSRWSTTSNVADSQSGAPTRPIGERIPST